MTANLPPIDLNLDSQFADLLKMLVLNIGCRSARLTMFKDGRLTTRWACGAPDPTPTAMWQKVLKFGQLYEASDGNCSFIGSPLRDTAGKIIGVLSVHDAGPRDYTEAAREQVRNLSSIAEGLLRSENSNRSSRPSNITAMMKVLEALPMAVIAKSVRFNFEFVVWNKEAEKLFGMKAGDVLGKTDFDLFSPDEAAFFRSKDLETIRGRERVDIPEESVTGPTGHRALRTHKIPIFDENGNPEFVLVFCQDVTQVKDEQAAASRAREELSQRRSNSDPSTKT